jgi:SAM-dependent methyltransferase
MVLLDFLQVVLNRLDTAMGISSGAMEGLLVEHRFTPFSGTACTLGRQTMALTPDQTLELFAQMGVTPKKAAKIELDKQTSFSKGETILDQSFFSLLGFEKCVAVDVSDFEGAEIIADLNKQIPSELEDAFDLIVDGSLLDNIFDPVTGLKNIARMTKPNGRVMIIDLGNYSKSFTGIPYTIFTAAWFYDYFAINDFADVQVYAACHHPDGVSVYMIDHQNMTREFGGGLVKPLLSAVPLVLMVFAQKGRDSSWHKTPTQHAYRSEKEWLFFEERVEKYKGSGRPVLFRSSRLRVADDYSPGWVIIDDKWRVRRPYHENVSDLTGNGLRRRFTRWWR